MRYISRSGYEEYVSCERKYLYHNLYSIPALGVTKGLDTPVKNENFTIGLALHAAMEAFFTGKDKEGCLQAIGDEWALQYADTYKVLEVLPDPKLEFLLKEWRALAVAMFLGWLRVRRPRFLLEFEPLMCEEEVPLQLTSDLVIDTRADLVVRARRTGHLFVINWKTSSTKDLFGEYSRSIQMMTEALAVEDKLGEEVAGVIAEGFYKGTKKDGHYSSPLIWGYERNEVWSAKWVSGWNKIPMWLPGYELPEGGHGLSEWIEWMPEGTVQEQYMQTPPLMKDNKVTRDWLRQVVQRETDLQAMMDPSVPEEDRLLYFFQRFGKQCNYCPFDSLCQQAATPEAMVKAGLLVPRVDHHKKEEKP